MANLQWTRDKATGEHRTQSAEQFVIRPTTTKTGTVNTRGYELYAFGSEQVLVKGTVKDCKAYAQEIEDREIEMASHNLETDSLKVMLVNGSSNYPPGVTGTEELPGSVEGEPGPDRDPDPDGGLLEEDLPPMPEPAADPTPDEPLPPLPGPADSTADFARDLVRQHETYGDEHIARCYGHMGRGVARWMRKVLHRMGFPRTAAVPRAAA